MPQNINDALEALVDGSTLATVLRCLGEVCADKTIHLAENWQDRHAAGAWASMANRLDSLSSWANRRGI